MDTIDKFMKVLSKKKKKNHSLLPKTFYEDQSKVQLDDDDSVVLWKNQQLD